MSDEKKKSEKSMLVKILGGLVVVGFIAYNGWVIWHNNGEDPVKATTKELLTELIPQSLEEDVVEFVEVESFKINNTTKDKWAGEANAKVKVKETGNVGSIRFTFDVEKKGEMVYVQNLSGDEESCSKLLEGNESKKEEKTDASTSKITDWGAYVVDVENKAEKMTALQKVELCKKEQGRAVAIEIEVLDVRKSTEYEGEVVEISATCAIKGGDIRNLSVLVENGRKTSAVYKKALELIRGTRVRIFGTVHYSSLALDIISSMGGVATPNTIVATQIEIVKGSL